MTSTVGLVRLSLTRGLFSAATAAVSVIWGYAMFVGSDSAFLTGLLDAAYTVAFAAASTWLTIRLRHSHSHSRRSDRMSIATTGLVSAAAVVVVGLAGMDNYVWLVLLVVVIGVATGLNYPAWYSQLRRSQKGDDLHGRIGTYESIRVVAVLGGTAGGGLIAHLLEVRPTMLLIAVVFAAGGSLALTFPRPVAAEGAEAESSETSDAPFNMELYRRARLQLGLLAALQFLVAPIVAVTPVLGVDGVDGGVAHVGFLSALYGVGGVLQFVTSKAAARGAGTRVIVSPILVLMVMAAISAAVFDSLASAGFLMAAFGFGGASIATLINAEIQSVVPEQSRDKQVAIFALVLAVPFALGSAAWGLAADFVSVPIIAIIAALATSLVTFLLLLAWRRLSGRWARLP